MVITCNSAIELLQLIAVETVRCYIQVSRTLVFPGHIRKYKAELMWNNVNKPG